MDTIRTDVCVIGAGSGGLSVAAGAVQMGARVVLIEGAEMGGDCLNTGCVPSKALIAAAKHAHWMTSGAGFGVAPSPPQVDFAAVKDHVAATIASIAPHDSQERFETLGCTVIRDWARFVSPREVEAGGQRIRARRFVIATGSTAFVPPIPGLESVPYLTNETIFALRDRPEHLIVVGGGPIGLEMAQAHRRLGCRVTVIEGARALGRDDPELAAVVLARLRAEGVTIMEEAPVVRVRGEAGRIEVVTGDGSVIHGSHILIAVGRSVSLDRLDLAAANVAHDRKGVTVGADLRSTTNRRVHAIGDAAGGLQFTHVAGYHAGVVVRQMLFGLRARATTRHIPWATYTDPEMAQVGLTEAQAVAEYGAERVTVLRAAFADNDRARAEALTEGLIKVMVVKGRPVGASIVGPQAGELIGLWALALANGLKMSAIAGMVLPYPTLSEVSKRAASAYFSPKLFDSPVVRRVVGLVQRWLP
ncbi:dihydrolipoamide dehydrogenase [Aliigemmobacter aestuarii]|uniref:Dihydrolipoamide dehydrogenase n=1 Tax=Aliigemmobacter aestuarii TaxID=1445661 RepID=A0A4V3V0T4_9RHOB|nr:FAD-dependent oxidoreductase [Gemmobacter aestuarii]THD85192.1 dihydrolipoamide dehydrogenase [Gemmobacter aestuarii]